MYFMGKKLVIVGAGGHAMVIADAAESRGENLITYIADNPSPFGLELNGKESDLPHLLARHLGMQVCLGIGDNFQRKAAVLRIKSANLGVAFPTIIHPSAIICKGAIIGEGAFIGAGAVISADAKVGAFAIVNTRASLDHHSTLGDYASLAPAAATGGNAHIGEGTAIGMGVMIHHGVRVGTWSVVGSMALVSKDLPEQVVACGQPARVVRGRNPGDAYL